MARKRADGGTCQAEKQTSGGHAGRFDEQQGKTAAEMELEKLEGLFRPLPEHERSFLQPLLENAAFMRATLDVLQAEIRLGGAVESYQNGANQHGVKISATVQAYNQTMKTYHALMEKLLAKLPAPAGEQEDRLSSFRL